MSGASTKASGLGPARLASDPIIDAVRKRILLREYAPGQRLAIRELAREFGTSITPVRDALQVLASQHLVEMSPRGASRIAELTPRDIRELYQVRLMIEPRAAEMAAKSLTADELNRLVELAEVIERRRVAKPSSTSAYVGSLSLGEEFHRAVVRGARNSRLDEVFENLQVQQTLVRAPQPVELDSPERAAEHKRITSAILARDGQAAAAALTEHLEASRDDLLRRMSSSTRK